MMITAAAGGTDATRGTSTMGGHYASGRGASAERGRGGRNGSTGPDGSGGSARARAAKYNMATLEERTRFKLRCEVLMLEIKDRNHRERTQQMTMPGIHS